MIFLRHALPGERVVARVTDGGTASRFLRADAVQVLDASPERRDAPCAFAGPGGCGGCDWQHTSAAFGRELKTRVVREQLRRLAGIDWDGVVEQVPGDVEGLRWRTRVEFSVSPDRRLGLRKHRSHDVVPVDDCLIAVPEVAATGLLAESVEPDVTGVDVAVAADREVVAVDLPVRDSGVPNVVERVAPNGVAARGFRVSSRGFWQVHPGAAATFVAAALDGLQPRPGSARWTCMPVSESSRRSWPMRSGREGACWVLKVTPVRFATPGRTSPASATRRCSVPTSVVTGGTQSSTMRSNRLT
ncbi:hypothetical protein [Flexivirga alba]|uniref:Class I SAM-dependent RNA methyltransferase n=1 Tax=Flexivirga alba TaxID=702742 RepID=A0ABW2AI25_9MICO